MITAYAIHNGVLKRKDIKPSGNMPTGLVWIDLQRPTREEELFVEEKLGISAPSEEEIDQIEVKNPFYQKEEAAYMTVTVLCGQNLENPESDALTFILLPKCLVTVHFSQIPSIEKFIARSFINKKKITGPENILDGVLRDIIHRTANSLERLGNNLDGMLLSIFEKTPDEKVRSRSKNSSQNYNMVIKNIGHYGNLISKNRESLLSINRLMIFLNNIYGNVPSKKPQKIALKTFARELSSLSEYANFLSQRNSFLLDATLGMISVEQNMIIKVFTVAAAAFMPPTLIASIYGMNFRIMPELSWQLGYPFALVMIVISALLPIYYFKRKGWM